MFNYKRLIQIKLILILIFITNVSFADNHNFNEILEIIQKDLLKHEEN